MFQTDFRDVSRTPKTSFTTNKNKTVDPPLVAQEVKSTHRRLLKEFLVLWYGRLQRVARGNLSCRCRYSPAQKDGCVRVDDVPEPNPRLRSTRQHHVPHRLPFCLVVTCTVVSGEVETLRRKEGEDGIGKEIFQ